MGQVKLRIDIKEGTVDVETDVEAFGDVMARAEALLDKFIHARRERGSFKEPPKEEASDDRSAEEDDRSKGTKRRKSSSGAKVVNWRVLDNLLDEKAREDLRAFYAEKKPKTQNEKIAVVTVKMKEILNRDGFDGHEIHTALQVVKDRTPANLGAVFGNMSASGLGSQKEKKFIPNFRAVELVQHDLPASKEAK